MKISYLFPKTLLIVFGLAFVGLWPTTIFAQENNNDLPIEQLEPGLSQPEQFYIARVINIEEEFNGATLENDKAIEVEIVKGERKGEKIIIRDAPITTPNKIDFKVGDKVVVGHFQSLDETVYYIADYYRIPALAWITAIFFVTAIFFGRLKGLTSILGLAFTILVLAFFVVPKILAGWNPVLVTLLGSFVIAIVGIFLSHGFAFRTSLALLSTLITLSVATGLAVLSVNISKLLGFGSEDALLLQGLSDTAINLKGLLLGGIIIGTLGILDDVTTNQTAAVDEISKANESLSFRELYHRGFSVGREHIAALINTLVLAYAGASLPLFLLFHLNDTQPFWTIFNGEFIAEEIIRTIVGSTALILAVPIATTLAAYFLPGRRNK